MSDLYSKNVLEFVTVSTEYCAFIEKSSKYSRKDFISKSRKLLSLLYLKASILGDVIINSNQYEETEYFVTEEEWNRIEAICSTKLGQFNDFFFLIDASNYESNESVSVSISECCADVYQDLFNLISSYRVLNEDEVQNSISKCYDNFKNYWGIRAIRIIEQLHNIEFSGLELDE